MYDVLVIVDTVAIVIAIVFRSMKMWAVAKLARKFSSEMATFKKSLTEKGLATNVGNAGGSVPGSDSSSGSSSVGS